MTGCDHKFHPNRSIGRRVIAFPTFCNMAAVRHLEYEFCYSGPSTKSTMRFDYPVKIWCRSDIPRRRYYDFIALPCSLAWKCLTTPPFGGFLGYEPLKIVGRHPNPEKAHVWVMTRHLSHKRLKSVQGFDLGASSRKKYNQDRTGQQKSHKSVMFHIFGGTLPVKILQWNEIWHRGRCPQVSYVGRVLCWKFNGCKFYRGLKFGLLHWLCLWALTQCSATALPVIFSVKK